LADIPLNWVPDGWLPAGAAKQLLAERLHVVASFAEQRRAQASDAATGRLFEVVRVGVARTP
jgi:hypothetical protein